MMTLLSVCVSVLFKFLHADELCPRFSAEIQNTTVVAGREGRLSCTVEDIQKFKVAWVHYGPRGSAVLTIDNHVLTTNRRIAVTTEKRNTWTLVVTNVTIADRGNYMCQISTVPPMKKYGWMEVKVPPLITVPPSEKEVPEGEDVSLECHAEGDPEPKIVWKREDGSELRGQSGIITGSILNISRIQRNESGAFLCVASNGVPPAVSARAIITVKYKPSVRVKIYQPLEVTLNGSVSFQCFFESYPAPTVEWRKQNSILRQGLHGNTTLGVKHDGVTTLLISPVKSEDFGDYTCEIQNGIGKDVKTIQLREVIIPSTTTTTASTQRPELKFKSRNMSTVSSAKEFLEPQINQGYKQPSTTSSTVTTGTMVNGFSKFWPRKDENKYMVGLFGESSEKESILKPKTPDRFIQQSPQEGLNCGIKESPLVALLLSISSSVLRHYISVSGILDVL